VTYIISDFQPSGKYNSKITVRKNSGIGKLYCNMHSAWTIPGQCADVLDIARKLLLAMNTTLSQLKVILTNQL